ncbi:MAG: hypothetical protein ACXAEU_20010 [Candidatus Hodarchaeales archaeon]
MKTTKYPCKKCGWELKLTNDDMLYGGKCPGCGHPFREELKDWQK